jgi:hypothetical protein
MYLVFISTFLFKKYFRFGKYATSYARDVTRNVCTDPLFLLRFGKIGTYGQIIIAQELLNAVTAVTAFNNSRDRLCGLVARVPGYRYRDPGSIPGATRYSEK